MTRHFLRDDDLAPDELLEVLDLADTMKRDRLAHRPLEGPRAVALLFDKPTLRTQLSFSVGVSELGGAPILVDGAKAGVGVRESIDDVTRVLDRQVAAIVWRTYGHDRIEAMAAISRVPVVNALTDSFHPCQLLADLQTIREHKGRLAGLHFAYVGDAANNMAHSYLLAGASAGLHVSLAGPDGYQPDASVVDDARRLAARTRGSLTLTTDPVAAVDGADVVATDTWVSMGQESEKAAREKPFLPYAVTQQLLQKAQPDVSVLHCLPAYRDSEIATDVLEGPHSIVWDEAENRLHAQKALLAWLLERA
ncbi:MAG: ornithine carbamoyltransferase [Jatrophihabitans sp.]|uniref:ornithine carbamoyltransferase n=1 Tax=Jatrophihabitans sp. TaxID=1932789 RepID=UPI003F7D3DE6